MNARQAPHLRGEVKGMRLTPRETQVIALMRQFRDRRAVALILGISPSTVKQHLWMANRKLAAKPYTRQWA